NLGNLSKNHILTDARPDVVSRVVARLTDEEALQEARVHPIAVLKALATYSQGHGLKSDATWPVVGRVVDALDAALYMSFRYALPSGKRIMLGVDFPGSMWQHELSAFPGLSTHQGAAVLALTVASVEPNATFVKFDTHAQPISISPRQRMDDVVRI